MGLDTKIYSNHKLTIQKKAEEIVEFLFQMWKGRTKIHGKVEVDEIDMTSDVDNFKIFLNPKLIEFELDRFNQITISTNFIFTMNIRLYANTICFTPTGIGRNATNMIVEFMDEPFGIYSDDQNRFREQKENWHLFKSFLKNFTKPLEGNIHLYINDGQFQGIEDLALEGATIEKMIEKANEIVKPCRSKEQFIEEHTTLLNEITYINGDIWFHEEVN